MQFVLEEQRARYRQLFGPTVTFPELTNGLRRGSAVRFDRTIASHGGQRVEAWKEGLLVDQLERDVGRIRIREVVIVVPAVTDINGVVRTPERLFRKPISALERHGGPVHEAVR